MKPKTLKQREKEHLQQILELTGWNEEKASLLLKIPLAQVQRKMRENAIKKPDAKESSNL
jgi:transcriptional regulator with GAF, ATPase, and Fis domain